MQPKTRIKTKIDNENCYISISDQGEGVIEESLEKIFEPFHRLDTSRNRETGGFGLGLSLVKQIVELHKGLYVVQQFVLPMINPNQSHPSHDYVRYLIDEKVQIFSQDFLRSHLRLDLKYLYNNFHYLFWF